MYRPIRAHLAALLLGGTALALVGGICGYFGTDFGYHLLSAARCGASLEGATRADLEAFMADLLARRMASTAATHHKALKIIYGWLAEQEEIPTNLMATRRGTRVDLDLAGAAGVRPTTPPPHSARIAPRG
jgi:hypothetical protein